MSDGRALREQMVDALAAAGHIRSPQMAAAFQSVPRELFLPHVEPSRVYQDEALHRLPRPTTPPGSHPGMKPGRPAEHTHAGRPRSSALT